MTSASKKSDVQMATLLRLREATRDERRSLLAKSHRADEELIRQLNQLGTEQQRVRNESRESAQPGEVNVDRLLEADRCIVGLQILERGLRKQRESLAAEIERRRQSLVEADQDVQVLEKLQDRRRQGYRLEEERQHAKLLDEAALQAGTRGTIAALRSA